MHPTTKINVLTFSAAPVDEILVGILRASVIASTLVEHLSRLRVSIVNADDAVTPSCPNQSVSLSQEPLLVFVLAEVSKLIT